MTKADLIVQILLICGAALIVAVVSYQFGRHL